MKKYRFRKIFFLCSDKRVIEPGIQFTTAFQYKEYADIILKEQGQRMEHYMFEDKTKPLPKKTVEGFYLVPEALFDEILKGWTKD